MTNSNGKKTEIKTIAKREKTDNSFYTTGQQFLPHNINVSSEINEENISKKGFQDNVNHNTEVPTFATGIKRK